MAREGGINIRGRNKQRCSRTWNWQCQRAILGWNDSNKSHLFPPHETLCFWRAYVCFAVCFESMRSTRFLALTIVDHYQQRNTYASAIYHIVSMSLRSFENIVPPSCQVTRYTCAIPLNMSFKLCATSLDWSHFSLCYNEIKWRTPLVNHSFLRKLC